MAVDNTHVPEFHDGASIINFSTGSLDALRISSEGPHAIIRGVDISPSVMPHCTLMIGLYLERIVPDSNGWVLNQEESGWDRSIAIHDGRANNNANSGPVTTQRIRSGVGINPTW